MTVLPPIGSGEAYGAFVIRRDPTNPQPNIAANVNEQVPINEYPQRAWEDVREGDFYLVGKPLNHCVGTARIAFTNEANQYAAVMSDSFLSHNFDSRGQWTQPPKGRQAPYRERVNIEREQAIAYGNLVTLGADDPGSYSFFPGL